MITLQSPKSKSFSHRILISSALAQGKSIVRNVLDCDDTRKTMAVLSSAGAEFTSLSGDKFQDFSVVGMQTAPQGGTEEKPLECYIGESGTSARLLTAILSVGYGHFKLCGALRMHQRPMGSLVEALKSIGANITSKIDGYAPLFINANGLKGGQCNIALDESSQYLSGLLLTAPLCAEGMSIIPSGKKAVSWPYVALTLQVMQDFGINFSVKYLDGTTLDNWQTISEIKPNSICIDVKKGKYNAGEYTVEGDWSGASYLLASGVLGKKAVRVEGLNLKSAQGDRALFSILKDMGANIREEKDGVIVEPSSLNAIEVDMNFCPDIVPTVAVLAACANGITRIYNVPHLRVKESDRISATAQELTKIGIKTEELDDGIIIHGVGNMNNIQSLQNHIAFSAHNDHRIAMSMSLFSLQGAELSFDDPNVINKSFPEYWNVLKHIKSN